MPIPAYCNKKHVEVGSVKKYVLLLAAVMFLVGCGTEEIVTEVEYEEPEKTEKEIIKTVISKDEHDITLIDNDDFTMILKESEHIRLKDYEERDELTLVLNVENKQNKTINLHIDDLYIDGDNGDWDIGMSETELEPNATDDITVYVTKDILNDDKLISFEEHIKGEVIYSDYERSRVTEYFSEYINE